MTSSPSVHKRIQKGFDLLAPLYDQLVFIFFGRRLSKSRRLLWEHFPGPFKRVALIGEGSGEFLLELLSSGRAEKIECVDISGGMLSRARRRIEIASLDCSRVAFHQVSVQNWQTDGGYDLIVTNYFLDLFEPTELRLVMKKLHSLLGPGGLWSFVDFTGRTTFFFRQVYKFFRLVCHISAERVPDYQAEFVRLGLTTVSEKKTGGMIQAALYRKS